MTEAVDVDLSAIERRADTLVSGHRKLMQALIAMRNRHQLTQADVAERMGVSQPTVAAFERYDSNPTLATIRRYALAVEANIVEQVIDDCQPMPLYGTTTAGTPSPRFRPTRALPRVTPTGNWTLRVNGAVSEYA